MIALLEELVVCIAISLGIKAATAAAEVLFVPGKAAKSQRPPTCSSCGKALSPDLPLREHESSMAIPE
jgi:hypothetical protein